ncbi:hypothetical protein Tco_1492446 [Tanacetum coccineum]
MGCPSWSPKGSKHSTEVEEVEPQPEHESTINPSVDDLDVEDEEEFKEEDEDDFELSDSDDDSDDEKDSEAMSAFEGNLSTMVAEGEVRGGSQYYGSRGRGVHRATKPDRETELRIEMTDIEFFEKLHKKDKGKEATCFTKNNKGYGFGLTKQAERICRKAKRTKRLRAYNSRRSDEAWIESEVSARVEKRMEAFEVDMQQRAFVSTVVLDVINFLDDQRRSLLQLQKKHNVEQHADEIRTRYHISPVSAAYSYKMALQIGGFNLPGAGVREPIEVPTKVLC